MKHYTKEELVTVSTFEVTSADTDMEARLRLGALVNFLIQSAIRSADSLGFGFRGIRTQRLFWVLSRLTVKINRPFTWYEPLEVETWPKDIERIIYLRDFNVRDGEGKPVILATSGWLAVDLESRRPKKIDNTHADMFSILHDKHALELPPEKLMPADGEDTYEIKSTYFDLDLNKHVTSSRYVDWMMDTFGPDFHKSHYPSALSVNYLKETMPGETMRISRRKEREDTFLFEGTNLSSDTTAFRGKIVFDRPGN